MDELEQQTQSRKYVEAKVDGLSLYKRAQWSLTVAILDANPDEVERRRTWMQRLAAEAGYTDEQVAGDMDYAYEQATAFADQF